MVDAKIWDQGRKSEWIQEINKKKSHTHTQSTNALCIAKTKKLYKN